MLKLINIIKTYPGDSRRILNQVSLEANRGELIAIVGKSGSGKSTLLSIIAGIEKPTEGSVHFDHFDLTNLNEDQYASFRNENIGIVFQEFNLVDDLNVLDNIMLPLSLCSDDYNQNKKQAMQLLKKFRIEHIYKRLAKNLSGGEKAKVSIARAMIQNPDIILCDEPTGSLDNESASIVFQTLKQISKEKIVIVVTHDDALIEDYATRLIRIHDGIIESDQSKLSKTPVQSNLAYRIKPKKENTKAITKILVKNLFQKNSKTTFSITSLTFSFVLMLISTMLLFGFRYNSLESLRSISNDFEYVGHHITNTLITNDDINYIKAFNNVNEVFIQKTSSVFVTNETVTFGTTLETISNNNDNFKFKKQLVGSYPDAANQVIVSYDLAKLLGGQNLTDIELLNTLKTQEVIVTFSNNSTETYNITGFINTKTKSNQYVIFYQNQHFDEWLENQDNQNIVFEIEQLVVMFDSNKMMKQTISDIYENKQIVLSKSTAAIENYIITEYRFLSGLLLATSIISIGLGIATIYIQMKHSMRNQTKKISILIALGAQKETIKHLFLYESLFIGIVSFVIAILFSSLIGVFIDLALGSQFILTLSEYQNVVIAPIRILASGWLIYPIFFVIVMSLIYAGCSYLIQKSNFYYVSENLKKD